MAYIHTSKTRRNKPNGRLVALRDPVRGETRFCDERKADDLLRYSRWGSNPVNIPGATDPEPGAELEEA